MISLSIGLSSKKHHQPIILAQSLCIDVINNASIDTDCSRVSMKPVYSLAIQLGKKSTSRDHQAQMVSDAHPMLHKIDHLLMPHALTEKGGTSWTIMYSSAEDQVSDHL
jgi:hypothetical protein